MPLTDYTKTTYVNGSAPAINATNLNNAENKIKELDTKAIEKPSTAEANRIAVFDTNQNKLKDSGKTIAQIGEKSYGNASYTDSILANTTITKNIAIGSGKSHGMCVFGRTTGLYGIIVFFGTDNTKTLVNGYHRTDHSGSAWSRRAVGAITTGNLGLGVTNDDIFSESIRILECYISGTNLGIDFRNITGSAKSLSVTLDWEVW